LYLFYQLYFIPKLNHMI